MVTDASGKLKLNSFTDIGYYIDKHGILRAYDRILKDYV